MSVPPVLVEDDDVVMVSPPAVTINLDEETDNEKESSFASLLKNNTLMTKIVQRCLNMENNSGMSRVISKTLMPLYADTDSKFKESEQFTSLLKKILENLKNKPNYKFLHIKSLCEELKFAKYRRKVPFVTLSTELRREKHGTLQSGESNRCRNRRKTFETKNVSMKTDIIDLAISDDEPVITLDLDDDEKVGNDQRNKKNGKDDIGSKDVDNDKNNNSGQNHDISDDGDNDEVMIVPEIDVSSDQSNKENTAAENDYNKLTDTSECELLDSKNTNKSVAASDSVNTSNKMPNSCDSEHLVLKNDNKFKNISRCKSLVPIDSNKIKDTSNLVINNNEIDSISESEHFVSSRGGNRLPSMSESNNLTDTSDLLVPVKDVKWNKAMEIEREIAVYQDLIKELEEKEVTDNCFSSPYVQCDRYKGKIVQLYKKLCQVTGFGDVNLLKQRVVRLTVAEGHPPGPVRRFERFLNSTIDETGTIPLPDLHDVVRCVTQSNIVDQLGWNKDQIIKEAIALFSQCGVALRKSRQRREYRDLLSLMKNRRDDSNDPADNDPELRAKLEINKVIGKANEDEIFDRFVKMEYFSKYSRTYNHQLENRSTVQTYESSDTESDCELDLTPPKRRKTNLAHNHNKSHETQYIDKSGDVNSKPARPNVGVKKAPHSKHENVLHVPRVLASSFVSTNEKNVNTPYTQNSVSPLINKSVTSTPETDRSPTMQGTITSIGYSTGLNPKNSISKNESTFTTLKPMNTTTHNIANTLSQYITLTPIQNVTRKSIQNITQTPTQDIKHKSTQNITQTPTQNITQTPTQNITHKSIQNITRKPNQNITQTPTQNITQTPTQNITHIQTQNITQTPTQNITHKSTQNITQTPTQNITQTPTQNITHKSIQNITRKSNQNITQTPTQNITQTPIQNITHKSIQNITRKSNQNITQTPTQNITQTPTQNITQTPTQNITQTPTQNITQTPTQNITQTPTQNITQTPTQNMTHIQTKNITHKSTQNITQTPTQDITHKSTQDIIHKSTQAVTQSQPRLIISPLNTTHNPTQNITQTPTQNITQTPTQNITQTPTQDIIHNSTQSITQTRTQNITHKSTSTIIQTPPHLIISPLNTTHKAIQNIIQTPTQNITQTPTQNITQTLTQDITHKSTQTITQTPPHRIISPLNTTHKATQNITQTPTRNIIQTSTQNITQTPTQAITHKSTQTITQTPPHLIISPLNTSHEFTQNITQTPTRNIIQTSTQNITQTPTQDITHKLTQTPPHLIISPLNTSYEFTENITQTPTELTVLQNIADKNNVNVLPQQTVQNHVTNTLTRRLSSNSVQKKGSSNRYAVACESTTSEGKPPEKRDDCNPTEIKLDKSESESVKVKTEDAIKQEPIDINSLLNALGDNYISTIFDIEDPFLVVDISSDSSDDDLS